MMERTLAGRRSDLIGLRFNGADFASDLPVEVEISRRRAGDQSCATAESQILDGPLNKNQDTTLKLDNIHQVDERPDQPGRQAGNLQAEDVGHSRRPPNDRQISLIEILESLRPS